MQGVMRLDPTYKELKPSWFGCCGQGVAQRLDPTYKELKRNTATGMDTNKHV